MLGCSGGRSGTHFPHGLHQWRCRHWWCSWKKLWPPQPRKLSRKRRRQKGQLSKQCLPNCNLTTKDWKVVKSCRVLAPVTNAWNAAGLWKSGPSNLSLPSWSSACGAFAKLVKTNYFCFIRRQVNYCKNIQKTSSWLPQTILLQLCHLIMWFRSHIQSTRSGNRRFICSLPFNFKTSMANGTCTMSQKKSLPYGACRDWPGTHSCKAARSEKSGTWDGPWKPWGMPCFWHWNNIPAWPNCSWPQELLRSCLCLKILRGAWRFWIQECNEVRIWLGNFWKRKDDGSLDPLGHNNGWFKVQTSQKYWLSVGWANATFEFCQFWGLREIFTRWTHKAANLRQPTNWGHLGTWWGFSGRFNCKRFQ